MGWACDRLVLGATERCDLASMTNVLVLYCSHKRSVGMSQAGKQKQGGFTIVETLIVLAITGVMFVATAALVSNQLSRYRYRDSMLRIEEIVRNNINDVQTGYIPDAAGTSVPGLACATTAAVGTSVDCEFIGKQIVFKATGIEVSPLVMRANSSVPFASAGPSELGAATALTIRTTYPEGLSLVSSSTDADRTIYVVYQNALASNGTFIGGAQSVVIYDSSKGSGQEKICFDGIGRKGAVRVGGSLGLGTELLQSDDHAGCS